MPGYNEQDDTPIPYHKSPLDPWGLLDPIEKAHAAVAHARLMQNPKPPFVPTAPAERQMRIRARDQVGPDACPFSHIGDLDWRRRVLTHVITDSALSRAVGQFACLQCAEAIEERAHAHHRVRHVRAEEAPNWFTFNPYDLPNNSGRGFTATVPHLTIAVADQRFIVCHDSGMPITAGNPQRWRRMANALYAARSIADAYDWADVWPEDLTGPEREALRDTMYRAFCRYEDNHPYGR
jgi:hypothetical protein